MFSADGTRFLALPTGENCLFSRPLVFPPYLTPRSFRLRPFHFLAHSQHGKDISAPQLHKPHITANLQSPGGKYILTETRSQSPTPPPVFTQFHHVRPARKSESSRPLSSNVSLPYIFRFFFIPPSTFIFSPVSSGGPFPGPLNHPLLTRLDLSWQRGMTDETLLAVMGPPHQHDQTSNPKSVDSIQTNSKRVQNSTSTIHIQFKYPKQKGYHSVEQCSCPTPNPISPPHPVHAVDDNKPPRETLSRNVSTRLPKRPAPETPNPAQKPANATSRPTQA